AADAVQAVRVNLWAPRKEASEPHEAATSRPPGAHPAQATATGGSRASIRKRQPEHEGRRGGGGEGGGGGGGRGRAPCDRSAAPTNQPARRPRAGNRANAPNPMPGSQKPVRAPACKSCLGAKRDRSRAAENSERPRRSSSSMQRRQLGASSPPPCGRGGVRPP
ncbi:unnamed protein product, partial [Prorocentrum cordatum]